MVYYSQVHFELQGLDFFHLFFFKRENDSKKQIFPPLRKEGRGGPYSLRYNSCCPHCTNCAIYAPTVNLRLPQSMRPQAVPIRMFVLPNHIICKHILSSICTVD